MVPVASSYPKALLFLIVNGVLQEYARWLLARGHRYERSSWTLHELDNSPCTAQWWRRFNAWLTSHPMQPHSRTQTCCACTPPMALPMQQLLLSACMLGMMLRILATVCDTYTQWVLAQLVAIACRWWYVVCHVMPQHVLVCAGRCAHCLIIAPLNV